MLSQSEPVQSFFPVKEAAGREQPGGKPELLFLTQVLPFPPDAGPKIKTFNLIKHLSNTFSITLVSFIRPDNTTEHCQELLKYCREVHTVMLRRTRKRDVLALLRRLVSREPFLMVRDRSAALGKLVEDLSRPGRFRAVHADQLNMAQFALAAPEVVRVLDEHNAVWTITDRLRRGEKNQLKRAFLAFETFKLRHYERQVCRQFDAVLAVTSQDEAALGRSCTVVPIGVDAEGTAPLELKHGSLNLVSLGTMFYPPNMEGALWFGEDVFPLILEREPRATYTIIGPKPPPALYAMAEKNPAIKITGYVADLRPVLADSAGLVVPLLSGGGMRVKILEALALALPIVSTAVGAEGIALEDDRTALLADTPQAFAEAVLRLLQPDGPGSRLAQAGRKLALERYDYRVAYGKVATLYSDLLAGSPDPVSQTP